MAEQKLAMSLDALIAQATTKKPREKKEKKPRAPAGQAPQSGPRKGLNKNKPKNANANGAAQPQPQQQQPKPKQQQPQGQPQQGQRQGGQRNRNSGAANLGVRGGQVQKRNVIEVPVKAIRPAPQPAPVPQRRQPFQQRQPAPESGKWQHDMFEDDYAPPKRAVISQVAPASTSSKLIIKNLHHQVSPDDLLELFSTCGTVKSHGVNYDTSGRSVGTAWVVFDTRAEAAAAKKEYNGVKLDGQAMEIAFSDEAGGLTVRKLASGISVQKPGAPGSNRAAGAAPGGAVGGSGSGGQRLAAAAFRESAAASRGGRGGARGRLRSAVVGRSQLDADLADYMQD